MADSADEADLPLQRFLASFWKDVDAGTPRPLSEYLAEFPGDDASIAREYAAVLYPTAPTRWNATARIGTYRILRELGRGGQGSVYLAEDERLGRRVALKVLSGLPALSSKAVQRLRREAEITARLDHPGICTTYDFGDSDGTAWIAMRYVEGHTLSTRIAAARSPGTHGSSEHLSFAGNRTGSEPPSTETLPSAPASARTRDDVDWVVRIVEQVARALHVAHENGVIHRDVKPANIMVTPDDAPVILDFGLANVVEEIGPALTGTGDIVGTPQYMAPEQLTRNAIQVDRRVDVYALGITLYEALTLTRPFDAPTRERLYQAIIAKEPPDPHRVNSVISRDLSAVVAVAIEKDRDRRYQTALQLAEDLQRVRERKPVLARRAGPLLRLTRWAQRNPAVAVSAASVFVVLLVALGVTALLLDRTNAALREKERTLVELGRLSDVKRVRDLTAAAASLFPSLPSRIPDLRDWLERAEAVAARLPLHERALAELDARTLAGGEPSIEDQWKREYLTELIRELRTFIDPDRRRGAMADVRERLEFATTVERRTVGDFAREWDAAIECIADPARSPKYGGLRIAPQIGLVPIGQNRHTGLWEFGDIRSGALPETDGVDAAYELEEATGVVFVLLPGGPFRMGSPEREPGRESDEAIAERVVPPSFMGKHEVSQAQWLRVMGANPSAHHPGLGDGYSLLHPVESIDWDEAAEFARRVNAVLPSETEWEYACRAGTTTTYVWGNEPGVLQGRANVSDLTIADVDKPIIEMAPWRDGFPYTAPVDVFEENGFGLLGMHGNVGEWCRDWYRPACDGEVPPDGGASPRAGAERSWRGGSWLLPPSGCRAAARQSNHPKIRSVAIGLRVARELDAPPR